VWTTAKEKLEGRLLKNQIDRKGKMKADGAH